MPSKQHGFGDDFNEEALPFNPILMQTVHDFLEEQKKATKQVHGTHPYEDFECKRCGDCCSYNYYTITIDPGLREMFNTTGKRDFYGYWILIEDPAMGTNLHFYMPIPEAKQKELRMFQFSGKLTEEHHEFLKVRGRHGYWVLREDGKLIAYNPSPCPHLERGLCAIYEKRPKICRSYTCGRYLKVM